jgi:hypothetical protein
MDHRDAASRKYPPDQETSVTVRRVLFAAHQRDAAPIDAALDQRDPLAEEVRLGQA